MTGEYRMLPRSLASDECCSPSKAAAAYDGTARTVTSACPIEPHVSPYRILRLSAKRAGSVSFPSGNVNVKPRGLGLLVTAGDFLEKDRSMAPIKLPYC